MTLVPCLPNPIAGDVIAADPGIEVHEDVLYCPATAHGLHVLPDWGLYDRERYLLDAGAYYRGPGKVPVGQSSRIGPVEADAAPADTYLYGGVLFAHYGHFVLSSLARHWPLTDQAWRARHEALPILYHGAYGRDYWFGLPYVAEFFALLGLAPERFMAFERPTRIRRLIVPRPAFEEHNFVHAAYPRLTHAIGARVLGPAPPPPRGPVFLSRTRLPVATQGFDNQAALDAMMARFGVTVAYPETLPVAEQIRLFAGHQVVAGVLGSAFHTAAFCPRPPASLCLSPTPVVNANYGLLDRANRQDARYLHAPSRHLGIDTDQPIWSRHVLHDPAAVARQLLVTMQNACR